MSSLLERGIATDYTNSVFAPMCADFIHAGHLNILNVASKEGKVVILLMTDEAMRQYKRQPYFSYEARRNILLSLRMVDDVIPCAGPQEYGKMIQEHKPLAFIHGDDWKKGVQADARAEAIECLKEYNGKLIEPQYTGGVSSTAIHKHVQGDRVRHQKIGRCVRGALNDLKRTPAVVSKELSFDEELLKEIINGNAKKNSVESLQRLLSDNYPTSVRDIYVDKDTSTDGVWVCSEKESRDSARIFSRLNSNGDNLPYYRYMDTATSSITPFKPELIEELIYVDNNDPMNPLVVMNKGHLLTQYTYFIGPVNFYYTVQGTRICIPMNTGDSCLITPYVPHSFTSRDKENPANAKIVAVTFSGDVKRQLSDLVHVKSAHMLKCSGNMRRPASVRRQRLLRKMELRGMSEENVQFYLLSQGLNVEKVTNILRGEGGDESWNLLAEFMEESSGAFTVRELVLNEEVAVQKGTIMHQNGIRCLARSRHFPDVGALEVSVDKTGANLYSRFFQYVFNTSDCDVEVTWDGHVHTLSRYGSLVAKPFINITATSKGTSKLFVAKVPGCVSLAALHECALFAEEGGKRMMTNNSKWW